MKENILEVSSHVLGRGRRSQPDWFAESMPVLMPLIAAAERHAHLQMLSHKTPSTSKAFRKAQRQVSKAVCAAKEKWVQSVAEQAE